MYSQWFVALYQALTRCSHLKQVCWFAACRVLIRFLRSAIDNKSEEHINQLRTEVDFIRYVTSLISPLFLVLTMLQICH